MFGICRWRRSWMEEEEVYKRGEALMQ
ncbi:hypothetical protein Patl1_10944 [Pistacia atlantica]|uniref:Uncharacterized protein n=1 Tax=Pistacia atlantica TaxID=434234 RepID=A0ACC1A6A5_9ROSI|nr:hypothetical protein Patl1_10944 [Pistacia atlantica]